MSYAHAKITSVTPLTGASPLYQTSNAHKFNIIWSEPDQTLFKTSYLRLYRYIGNKNECLDPNDIPPPPLEGSNSENRLILIYQCKQIFDNNDQPTGDYTVTKYGLDGGISETYTYTGDIEIEHTDDLSSAYSSTSNVLMGRYGISNSELPISKDRQLLNEIYTTERPIYYVIATYVKGVSDAAPYCVCAHMSTDKVDNFSVKTQVLHDILHYEFDMIWQTRVIRIPGDDIGNGISRTAVDINKLYIDAAQRGPTGRGGTAYVSCRGSYGAVFGFSLNNGQQIKTFLNTPGVTNGHGIAVDIDTGDVISATHQGNLKHFSYDTNGTLYSSTITDGSNIYNIYGATNIPQKASYIALNSRIMNGDWGASDSNILIYNIKTHRLSFPPIYTPIDNYGIASGPNSDIFCVSYKQPCINHFPYNGGASWGPVQNKFIKDRYIGGRGITVDLHNIYPHNNTNDKNTYDVIYASRSNEIIQVHYKNGGLEKAPDGKIVFTVLSENGADNNIGVGCDGDNNVWVIGKNIQKIYRMYDDPNRLTGGWEKYLSCRLSDYPFTATNTREVEWFLLRDHYLLDNATTKTFNGGSYTAKSAWLSLVEFKRRERDTDPATGVCTGGLDNSRGWHPTGYSYLWNYGIRIKPEYYNKDEDGNTTNDPKNSKAIALIRDWDRIFGDNDDNLIGRRIHPSFGLKGGKPVATPGGEPIFEEAQILNHNGYYRIQSANYNGYSYQYSDFTGNLLAAGIEESLYNYHLYHPEITQPYLQLGVSGVNMLRFIEDKPECYPWEFYDDNSNPPPLTLGTKATAVSSYDDLKSEFTLYGYSGSFIIKNWYLNTDDYSEICITDSNNSSYKDDLTEYVTAVNIPYTYYNPSRQGRVYLDGLPTYDDHYIIPQNIGPLYRTTGSITGTFLPYAWITAQDVYPTIGECLNYYSSSNNNIKVYERWPEPRFFLDIEDDVISRQDYFWVSTYAPWLTAQYSSYDKSDDFYRFSGQADAVRKDVIVGIEPLLADIQDRSIARTYPISSWYFTVSTDNQWLDPKIINFEITHSTPNLNDEADTQSDFNTLTSFVFQYGTNVISLTAAASGTSTVSDRVFSQCVNVGDMEPLAWYEVASGETVVDNTCVDINGYNAYFDELSTMGFISGYAPYMKVNFKNMSHPHTFPISSYHWDFGDIYNEGPDDIYDPTSNYYTIIASSVTQGRFSWNVPPKELPLWKTDVSDLTAVEHTYIMPGKYNVTLTVKASNTGSEDTYSKYEILTDNNEYKYVVYVEEVPPECGMILAGTTPYNMTSCISCISGAAPLTAYFAMTGFKVGSFPICDVKWQFGDHIETFSRYPVISSTSQGLSVINPQEPISAIIPWVFNPTTEQTYDIGLTAIVCNTNTTLDCNHDQKTGIIIPILNQKISNFELLKSRIDENGNLIYIFNDNDNSTTHTIMLTGELSDL